MKFPHDSLVLYAITADGLSERPDGRALVRAWLDAGVRAIQFREKGKVGEGPKRAFGRYLRAMTREYGALMIVNDSPELAAELGADGCHVGQGDVSVRDARRILGDERIIGLSTHGKRHVIDAQSSGADYLGVGPIFRSPTKDVGRPTLGAEFAGWAARESALPVVAIGGITAKNAASIVAAGCTNIAVVSAIDQVADPARAARELLEILGVMDRTTSVDPGS